MFFFSPMSTMNAAAGGGGGGSNLDISGGATLDSTYLHTGEDLDARGVVFNGDGTVMIIAGRTGDDLTEYALSTAWDVSTASVTGSPFSISAQNAAVSDLGFSNDGQTFYTLDFDGKLYQYTLSTGFDVSTASYASKTYDASAQLASSGSGLYVKPDGTRWWATTTNVVTQYDMSTPHDITTSSYGGFFLLSTYETSLGGVSFSSDGTKMYICGTANDRFDQFSLTDAFDVLSTSPTHDASVTISGGGNGTGMYVDQSSTYISRLNGTTDNVQVFVAT